MTPLQPPIQQLKIDLILLRDATTIASFAGSLRSVLDRPGSVEFDTYEPRKHA
uniref:Uncharacterized protein n=1 Tax=Onchocerca volvulus TaxID=6282 RepID=A0A8R1TQD1_ONCVO